jgi:hypothetical protein
MFFFFFFNKASILTVPLSKMNPRESAAFIASVSKHVEINPDGIRKIASEVLTIIIPFHIRFVSTKRWL